MIQPHSPPVALPSPEAFEEAAAAHPQDVASTLAFGFARVLEAADARADSRPVVVITSPLFGQEWGRLSGWGARGLGLDPSRLIVIRARREPEALWAFEEALKSGAVAAVLGALQAPSFVATRRLDFAARAGRTRACVLRVRPAADLSAARLRWQVCAQPSAPHPFDAGAPGAARLTAELVRSRGGQNGQFLMEQDDATGRFHLAAGLADHGLAPQPHILKVA